MSVLLSSLVDKLRMIEWVKETTELFVLRSITPAQRTMLQTHVNKMAAHEGSYEIKCEVAQGADGISMRLTVTINPTRNS